MSEPLTEKDLDAMHGYGSEREIIAADQIRKLRNSLAVSMADKEIMEKMAFENVKLRDLSERRKNLIECQEKELIDVHTENKQLKKELRAAERERDRR